jgi:hypothetical protein
MEPQESPETTTSRDRLAHRFDVAQGYRAHGHPDPPPARDTGVGHSSERFHPDAMCHLVSGGGAITGWHRFDKTFDTNTTPLRTW